VPRGDPNEPAVQPERVITGRRPSGVRPVSLAGFVVALVILGIVMFALPSKSRPWLAVLVVMGAIVAQGGTAPIEEARAKLFGK
jgi:hypothetical protein